MDFLEFLNKSVTPYHTVESLKALLACAEDENVQLFERGGALIVVRPPKEVYSDSKFRIALAHTDYPTLKTAVRFLPAGSTATWVMQGCWRTSGTVSLRPSLFVATSCSVFRSWRFT